MARERHTLLRTLDRGHDRRSRSPKYKPLMQHMGTSLALLQSCGTRARRNGTHENGI